MATSEFPDFGSIKPEGGGIAGLSKLFTKPKATEDKPKAEVPQVPVERIVSSPRRQLGRGRRDTILTGADGLA